MDRPKKENFTRKVFDGNFEAIYAFDNEPYERALNNYIDQLEKQNDEITKAYYDVINTFGKELYKREKALDKACEELSSHTVECDLVQCPFNCEYDSCDFDCGNKENWKEWCMRDEE